MKTVYSHSISLPLLIVVCSLFLVTCDEEQDAKPEPTITIESVQIPGGTFTMGSPLTEVDRRDNETEHVVTLKAFRMSKYEVTNTEFAVFLNDTKVNRYGYYPEGSSVADQLVNLNTSTGVWYSNNEWIPVNGYENHPVVDVTWYGATEFAAWVGGRLPTEAEWEYACRGDTDTAFNTGACLTDAQGNYAWEHPYNSCSTPSALSPDKTTAVGSFPANEFGLHDMHGNVWEWCHDEFGGNPELRVLRGGSWHDEASICRSACRHAAFSGYWSGAQVYGTTGIRVVFR
jgi:formylglycine-generating enzyme required for sulfatase activity